MPRKRAEPKPTTDFCLWCGETAHLLCDAVIGMNRRQDGTVIMSEGYTCDAPLCVEHAKRIGNICGDKKHTDTIDMCPEHKAGFGSVPVESMVANEDDAETVRRSIRVKASRSRMRLI